MDRAEQQCRWRNQTRSYSGNITAKLSPCKKGVSFYFFALSDEPIYLDEPQQV